MIRALVLGGALISAAACAPANLPEENAGGGVWRCDAEAARSLIGSHMGAVTFPREANVRMACTTCAVTQDYQENRLNLFFDEDTGIIERVSCG
ncbi:MAG: hypothetical protein ACK4FB_05235 [Brevundimonas sp.]|uniref:hypothetical protein n=1 Tax=Brevundimonas sp. TaxID=1871086 RepID=UPI0039196964